MNNVYLKLSIDNIKSNKKIYYPFILSSALSIFLMYIITSLKFNPNITNTPFVNGLTQILNFGNIIINVFVFIFLFYTNSFIIKRRKKELGLYGILGMDKKNVAKVVFYELFIIYLISLITGFLFSILLDKIMYLILLKMIGQGVQFGFYISFPSIFLVGMYISFIYILMYINSLRYIHLSKPIELLNSTKVGEREPKAKFIFSLIGISLIGGGYYLSLTTKNPLDAIPAFFVAVILVILGTYILFTTVSITILKIMKKTKKIYYKPENFISISGMIYRMKQNAVGLANIAILSTMVLVGISTTFSLWIGVKDLVDTRYPKDIVMQINNIKNSTESNEIDNMINSENKKLNIKATDFVSYDNLSFPAKIIDGKINTISEGYEAFANLYLIEITHLEDYNKNFNQNLELKNDEIYIYSQGNDKNIKNMEIFGNEYFVKNKLDKYRYSETSANMIVNKIKIIVKDFEEFKKLLLLTSEKGQHERSRKIYYNTNTTKENDSKLVHNIQQNLKNTEYSFNIESKSTGVFELKAVYAGIFFIGMFLSVLFLLATIIIMYYKQVAEGIEDKSKFEIMQKVGLDRKMIKKSINSQILSVFFMPLIVACIHLIFAFPLMTKLLSALMLTNTKLFIITTFVSVIVFSIMYYLIYKITSKVYYDSIK
ncbi:MULTISPECIES: ABC transporter permease [Helcococcus]|uniref:ABC transporter permease n=1 Tax=Helcococcus bovis TaxID=3153252 RepID=A0ABW9F7I5_9FIRM